MSDSKAFSDLLIFELQLARRITIKKFIANFLSYLSVLI